MYPRHGQTMEAHISDEEVRRVATALAGSLASAYAAPLVYPWSVRNFDTEPMAERVRSSTGPLSLYVHIPFCNYRCTFCFYAVRAGAKRAEMERYVAAVEHELEWIRPGTVLSHLFMGGGTPTALPADLLDRVLGAIFARVSGPAARAHTVEASPESVTDDHIRVIQEHGVGRMSMGIESLDDVVLDTIKRRHTPAEARSACRRIVDSGLTLNIDLIYGLPGQTEDSFRRDLETAVEAGVTSVSAYALHLNQGTPVARQLKAEEHFDLARLMRWRTVVTRAATELGLTQRHPYTFKQMHGRPSLRSSVGRGVPGDLLGVGVASRSQMAGVMYRNHERPGVYMDRLERHESPVETVFRLDAADRKTQFVARTLSDARPLERRAYQEAFGVAVDTDFGERLERLRKGGLVTDDGERILLTETGLLVYDRVLLCFFPQRAVTWLQKRAATDSTRAPAAEA